MISPIDSSFLNAQSDMGVEALCAAKLRGELRQNEAMSQHTSWRVGGAADQFYRPADVDDLACFLAQTNNNEAIVWIGLGSNLLVRDGGIRGVVIQTSGLLGEMNVQPDGSVRIEAGVACAKVARFCARNGLSGAEFLVGIPGTMGGALAMNAGAFGGETWPLVSAVETMGRDGQRYLRTPSEYSITYRHVEGLENEWFIAAYLSMPKGDSELSRQKIKQFLAQRTDTQPTGQSSSGSVFRNPPGDFAGRLIEDCGLKGYRIGNVCVSDKHANFFINLGGATAADIEALILYVAEVVEKKFEIRLLAEVHVIGDALLSQQTVQDD